MNLAEKYDKFYSEGKEERSTQKVSLKQTRRSYEQKFCLPYTYFSKKQRCNADFFAQLDRCKDDASRRLLLEISR